MRRRPERPVPPNPAAHHEAPAPVGPASAPPRPDDTDEWIADQLVRLVGGAARDGINPADPAHAAYLEWAAADARAQLTPDERLALAEEARQFAARMREELAQGTRGPASAPTPAPVDAAAGIAAGTGPVHALDALDARQAKGKPPRRRRRTTPVVIQRIDAAPVEAAGSPEVPPTTTIREAVRASARAAAAPWLELAVCAGAGRVLWDEPCDRWIAIPPEVPPGEHVALPVRGDSMQPLLHDGDTLLVRVGSACTLGDVVVARQPDDGYVVKRVGGRADDQVRLAADNPRYPDVLLPDDPALIVGVVVLRWCPHGGETAGRPPIHARS